MFGGGLMDVWVEAYFFPAEKHLCDGSWLMHDVLFQYLPFDFYSDGRYKSAPP